MRLAEDAAIRFADGKGYRDGWRATREACETTLFSAIAATRGVSYDEIAAVRASLDSRPFDWVVNLPMAAVCVLVAWPVTRRIRRRFGDEPLALMAAVLLVSGALAVAIVAIGQLWAGYVEVLRIGNGHLSYRAERIPWGQHRAVTFVMVCAAVWSLAACGRHPAR